MEIQVSKYICHARLAMAFIRVRYFCNGYATADGSFEVRSMEDLKVLKEAERQKKEAGKMNLQGTATSATANTTPENDSPVAEQQQQEKRSASKEGKVRLFSRGSKKTEDTAGEQEHEEKKQKDSQNETDSPAKRASKGAKPDKPAAPETRNSKSSEKVRLYARGSSKKEEANPNAGGEQQHEEHKKHHHKSHFGRSFTVEEVGTKEAAAVAAAQQEAPDAKAATSTTTGANKTTSTSETTTTKTASSTTTATSSTQNPNNTSFVQQVAQSEEISERITNFASAWHELVSDFSRGLNTDLPAIKESLRNSLVKVRDEDEEEAKRKKRSGSKEGLVRLHPRKSSKGEVEEKAKKEQEAAAAAASSTTTAVLVEQRQQQSAALPSNNNRALSKESLKSAASSYRSPNRGDEVWERYDNFRFSLKELVSDFKRGLNNDWTSLTTAAKKPKEEGKKRDSKEGLVRLHPRKSKAEEGAGGEAEAGGGAAASAAGEKKDTAVGPDTAAAKEQTPAGPAPSCLGQLAAVLGCGSKPPKKKSSATKKEDEDAAAAAASSKNKNGVLEQTPLTQEDIKCKTV